MRKPISTLRPFGAEHRWRMIPKLHLLIILLKLMCFAVVFKSQGDYCQTIVSCLQFFVILFVTLLSNFVNNHFVLTGFFETWYQRQIDQLVPWFSLQKPGKINSIMYWFLFFTCVDMWMYIICKSCSTAPWMIIIHTCIKACNPCYTWCI